MRMTRVFSCAAGDTWDSVALMLYGDERYAAQLLALNPALSHLRAFTGGETIIAPEQDGDVWARAPWR